MAALQIVSGVVSAVAGSTFQLAERRGVWLTISRFAEPKPALPTVGAAVRVGLDAKGYVRSLDPAPAREDPPPAPGAEGVKTFNTPPPARPGTVLSLRVAALQAAAVFLGNRPEATHQDVLAAAERFEEWLGR